MSISSIGSVSALWRYPVSSLGGERVQRASLCVSGLASDRLYAIVDDETQETINPAKRQWHAASMLQSKLDRDGTPLISIDGIDWFRHDDPLLCQKLSLFFGRPVSVHEYGASLAEKIVKQRYAFSPIHLLSLQSLELLQSFLPESLIDERRFRANIIADLSINGTRVPESSLIGKEFRIGGVRLRGERECGRCSFTTLEQLGIPHDRSVLRALISQFEKNFGIYCEVLEEGTVAVGDEVLWQGEPEEKQPIVIVGAGQAGAVVARTLRELGYQNAIAVYGDEPHMPYERPPLSKKFLASERDAKPSVDVLSHEDAVALGIDVYLREKVVHIDRAAKVAHTADGQQHKYTKLVLATGGSPLQLPGLHRGFGRVHSIRTADDAKKLARALRDARTIFVLGGGWLGLEVAATARASGIDVSLFARQTRLCSRVMPVAVAEFLAAEHIRHGVKLYLGARPKFTEHADRVEAELDGISTEADLLVVAIGISPNDYLARHAGLHCNGGVVTDFNGATSDQDIYAVGDVSRQCRQPGEAGFRLESWQNANEQAKRAAHAILGLDVPEMPLPRFWSDQYNLSIQIAGNPDPSAIPRRVEAGSTPFWEFDNFVVGANRPKEVHRYAAAAGQATAKAKPHQKSSPDVLVKLPLRHFVPPNEGDVVRVSIEDVGAVAIARVGGNYFAVQDRCPHAEASLAEGFIEGHRLVCPLHFAEFDLENGTAHNAPKGCANAQAYTVEINRGQFFISVPATSRSSCSADRTPTQS